MRKWDTLITNGTIIDGSGDPRYTGDIAIKDGVIAKIGAGLDKAGAEEVVDASGLIVAPGNIDAHTHYDAQINWDPYCTNSGWHGGTTVAVCNCGFGFAPCRESDRDRYMQMMENTEQVPLEAMRTALPWTWETFPEWMEHMKQLPKGVNVAAYMPINALMIYVMGYEAAKTRRATPEELRQMGDMLNEAMDHGAIGFAFSYLNEQNTHKDIDGSAMPTDNMCLDDLYYFADVLRERGEGIIQALVDIPKIVNREVAEELARRSGRPVIQNIISIFDALPEYHQGVLKWLDECEAKGLEVYSQALAYRMWNEFDAQDFTAWSHIPPFHEFTHAPGKAGKTALARDPDYRARARADYSKERMVDGGGPVETFMLTNAVGSDKWTRFEGKMLGAIAEELGSTGIDVFMDIVGDTDCNGEFRTTEAMSRDPAKITAIMRHPRVIPGTSDGGAHIKFTVGGHYPTDHIMWLVRELGTMTLEEMHFKQAAVPAKALGLDKRGMLKEGYAADLYIYDFEKLGYDQQSYEKIYDLPGGDWRRTLRSEGILLSMVNGGVTFRDNDTTTATPGKLVGNQGPDMDQSLAASYMMAAE